MQKVVAIEDNDDGLHIASLDDGKCWRLLSGWQVRSGHMRDPIAGSLLDDMLYAADDRWFSRERHHEAYENLLAMGADPIATLDENDNVFRYVDHQHMRDGARRWLGEAAAPSGQVVAVNWTAPADRKEG